MRVWLDDVRPIPSEFDVHVNNVEAAIELLKTGKVTHLSFDHDLGDGLQTGYDLATWVERNARNKLPRFSWQVHSANPVGAKNISAAMVNADKFWAFREKRTAYMVSLVFWSHFVVAAFSHIAVVLMIGGVLKLLIGQTALGFWETGLIMGITFYTSMYAINHVTSDTGFCVLTDVENFYRAKIKMEQVGRFTPRFYRKCGSIAKSLGKIFKRY